MIILVRQCVVTVILSMKRFHSHDSVSTIAHTKLIILLSKLKMVLHDAYSYNLTKSYMLRYMCAYLIPLPEIVHVALSPKSSYLTFLNSQSQIEQVIEHEYTKLLTGD